jgi:hypothetical protein
MPSWRHPAALACAIAVLGASVLTGCAGSGDTTTTVISPAVTPPNLSGTTAYRGTTEQGLPFVFAATPSAVVQLTFMWRAPCADGTVRSNSIRLGTTPVQNGSFTFDSTLQTGGVTHVEGTIQGDQASGTFSRSKGTSFGVDCAISDVHWNAGASSGSGQSS